MTYAICSAPVAPVRKEPSHKTEMVNQLLFGETMEILEEKGEWFKIRSLYDDYEGWLTYHLVAAVDEKIAMAKAEYVAANPINMVRFRGESMYVPWCAPLVGFDKETRKLWTGDYTFSGEARFIEPFVSHSNIVESAEIWHHVPYLWGGKTFMGVDCSGFVQTIFRCNGVRLKRDAWQQAAQGVSVEFEKIRSCDLAFFQNEEGRVVHVGLLLNNNKILHASGRVRIDHFDEQGIINSDTTKRTHHLHSIKRYF